MVENKLDQIKSICWNKGEHFSFQGLILYDVIKLILCKINVNILKEVPVNTIHLFTNNLEETHHHINRFKHMNSLLT